MLERLAENMYLGIFLCVFKIKSLNKISDLAVTGKK